MDRNIQGYNYRWIERYNNRKIGGLKLERQFDRKVKRQMGKKMDGYINRWKERQIDRRIDG